MESSFNFQIGMECGHISFFLNEQICCSSYKYGFICILVSFLGVFFFENDNEIHSLQ